MPQVQSNYLGRPGPKDCKVPPNPSYVIIHACAMSRINRVLKTLAYDAPHNLKYFLLDKVENGTRNA